MARIVLAQLSQWRQSLSRRPVLRAIVESSAWLFGDRILRLGLTFVVGIWTVRYLGPSSFGLLSYAVALATLCASLAPLGLDNIVVRELVREGEARDEILGTTFALQLLGGLLACVVANLLAWVVRAEDAGVRVLVGVVSLASTLHGFSAVELWFRAQVQSRYVAYARTFALVVTSAAKVAMILAAAPLVAFAWTATLEAALGALALVFAYRRVVARPGMWRARLARARRLLRDSWPLIWSGIVITIYMRVDQVMLGELASSHEVGAYAVAVRLSEVLNFAAMAIVTSSLPAIVAGQAEGDAVFFARLQRLYNAMAALGYAVAVPLSLLAKPIVNLLFGAAYGSAAPMLAVLVWSGLFVNLGVARSAFLTTMNWTRTHMFTVTLGGVANVLLNLWLIPRHGGMGAAIASCVAYWLAVHGACFLYPPMRRTGMMLTRALLLPKVW